MKISDLQKQGLLYDKVVPTSIDGLCVRNMSLDQLSSLQESIAPAEEDSGEDAMGLVAEALVDIARDPEGEKFEDMQTKEQAIAFGFATIKQMLDACLNALTGGNEEGET